jgi:AcrR family transcriptional regulator
MLRYRHVAPTDHATLKRSILEASLQLGTELGEEGLTMRAIARRLGVSATALYQHFDSKASILRAIRFDGTEKLHTYLAPAFELEAPADRIREHCIRYLKFARDNPWLYNVLLEEGENVPWDSMTEEERSIVERSGPAIAKALRDGKDDGTFSVSLDLATTPLRMWATLHGFATLILRRRIELTEGGDVEQKFVEALVATLKA